MRRKKENRRQQQSMHDLSMTPLIDTALTLLIIFMVASPLVHNAIKVTLPKGKSQEAVSSQNDDIIISIDKDMNIYINKEKIARSDLIESLKKMVKDSNQEKTVYVKADKAVPYGIVLELVDEIKYIGGIQYVALATQKNSQNTSPLS